MATLPWLDAPGRAPWAVNDVYCLGKNFRLHAREMGQTEEKPPVVFLKPTSALAPLAEPIVLPSGRGQVHHELEIVVAVAPPTGGGILDDDTAFEAIAGMTVGLDLTLRDEQSEAKRAGEPWTASKGFPRSAPIGPLVPREVLGPREGWDALRFTLTINGRLTQEGRIAEMIVAPAPALAGLSRRFSLATGDLLFAGTPHGVGPLSPGDELVVTFDTFFSLRTVVTGS